MFHSTMSVPLYFRDFFNMPVRQDWAIDHLGALDWFLPADSSPEDQALTDSPDWGSTQSPPTPLGPGKFQVNHPVSTQYLHPGQVDSIITALPPPATDQLLTTGHPMATSDQPIQSSDWLDKLCYKVQTWQSVTCLFVPGCTLH